MWNTKTKSHDFTAAISNSLVYNGHRGGCMTKKTTGTSTKRLTLSTERSAEIYR